MLIGCKPSPSSKFVNTVCVKQKWQIKRYSFSKIIYIKLKRSTSALVRSFDRNGTHSRRRIKMKLQFCFFFYFLNDQMWFENVQAFTYFSWILLALCERRINKNIWMHTRSVRRHKICTNFLTLCFDLFFFSVAVIRVSSLCCWQTRTCLFYFSLFASEAWLIAF